MSRTLEEIDEDLEAFERSVYHKDYYGDGPRKRLNRERAALLEELANNTGVTDG
jgi:hypothetical protein